MPPKDSNNAKIDGFVKSPSAALLCIPRHCGVQPKYASFGRICTPGPPKRGRDFYFAIRFNDFLRDHQNSSSSDTGTNHCHYV
ncbi:MAG: hypothetical protein NTY64_08660 [Deltaproteobacteria bacterium]|nr:hypothetical protein [Deltaproteobacteria bacterium]